MEEIVIVSLRCASNHLNSVSETGGISDDDIGIQQSDHNWSYGKMNINSLSMPYKNTLYFFNAVTMPNNSLL